MAEINFEKSIMRLEEIVEQLESGDASLDDAVKLYQEGIELCNKCSKKIENARLIFKEYNPEKE